MARPAVKTGPNETSGSEPAKAPPVVLVVEDEVIVRMAVAGYLRDCGFSVIEAADAEEALAILKTIQVDVVFTDVQMPETDGLEMIMKLHDARNPTPIIAMTGGHMQSDLYLKVAKSLGARRVLEKPFKLADLTRGIREVLAEPKATK